MYVGGQECTDPTLSADYSTITCLAPATPSSIDKSGGRGAIAYIFNRTTAMNFSDIADLDRSTATVTMELDEFEFSCDTCEGAKVSFA